MKGSNEKKYVICGGYDQKGKGVVGAKMALVMEDNAPLLTDDDAETMKNASVVPFYRLFNMQFSGGGEIETAKKN